MLLLGSGLKGQLETCEFTFCPTRHRCDETLDWPRFYREQNLRKRRHIDLAEQVQYARGLVRFRSA
jgi:hypothetical protein